MSETKGKARRRKWQALEAAALLYGLTLKRKRKRSYVFVTASGTEKAFWVGEPDENVLAAMKVLETVEQETQQRKAAGPRRWW